MIAMRRGSRTPAVLAVPDVEDRNKPAVELIVDDGVGSLAIEHTRIEPFAGLLEANAVAGRLLPERYIARPELELGSAYELAIGANDLTRAAKHIPDLRESLLRWVEQVVPTLPAGASQQGSLRERSVAV